MRQRRAFLNLPVELLEHIFGQPELSFRDVLRCKTVRFRICFYLPSRPPDFDAKTVADAPLFLPTGEP